MDKKKRLNPSLAWERITVIETNYRWIKERLDEVALKQDRLLYTVILFGVISILISLWR